MAPRINCSSNWNLLNSYCARRGIFSVHFQDLIGVHEHFVFFVYCLMILTLYSVRLQHMHHIISYDLVWFNPLERFFGSEGHVALDRNPGPGYDTLLLRMIPGDLLSAFPHRQFHTLPGLLDSWAAQLNSYHIACMPMQGGSLYHFYDGLWYDPAERRTHDLPCERRTRYRPSHYSKYYRIRQFSRN